MVSSAYLISFAWHPTISGYEWLQKSDPNELDHIDLFYVFSFILFKRKTWDAGNHEILRSRVPISRDPGILDPSHLFSRTRTFWAKARNISDL